MVRPPIPTAAEPEGREAAVAALAGTISQASIRAQPEMWRPAAAREIGEGGPPDDGAAFVVNLVSPARIAEATMADTTMASSSFHLHFHSPCFDGIISAVLMHDFLSLRYPDHAVTLHSVNYHLNDSWATSSLEKPCAIVDFLYHPDAQIWFDHHSTTFLSPALKEDFLDRRSPTLVYEPTFTSCALLLWQHLEEVRNLGANHFEKVQAADRIDSARYDSPEEAVFSTAPALRINAALAFGKGAEQYSERLVTELRSQSLDEVAESIEVRARYAGFEKLRDRGLQRLREAARLDDEDIVVFDVDGSDVAISRYGSFLFFPQARYSLGLVRHGVRGKITAMRNPWLDFPSVPLGEIFSKFGGGGHQRVASTRIQAGAVNEASLLLESIRLAIREAMEAQPEEIVHDRALQFL